MKAALRRPEAGVDFWSGALGRWGKRLFPGGGGSGAFPPLCRGNGVDGPRLFMNFTGRDIYLTGQKAVDTALLLS